MPGISFFIQKSRIIIKLLLSLMSLIILSGCFRYYYKAVSSPVNADTLNLLSEKGKSFVIHSGDSVFCVKDFKIQADSAYGNITGSYEYPYKMSGFPDPYKPTRYRPKLGDNRLKNEVHLYVNAMKWIMLPDSYSAVFALKDLWRLDIYEKDNRATDISVILGVFGIAAALLIALPFVIFILAMTIGSCPLVYINTGSGYELAGEIYSGAVYAPLERHDYLELPGITAENGTYRIKMTNEAKEIENTNLTELIVADHPAGTEVLYDKYGNYQTYAALTCPLDATNFNGIDVLSFISKKDKLCYFGDIGDNTLPLTDGVIISFRIPEGAKTGKLFISARNTKWLDYAYKSSHDLFGSYYDNWVKKQNKREKEDLIKWSLDQKIPLMIYIESNGQWQFADFFNNPGPACLRDDVLALDLHGIESNTLRIKLESGALFWQIDYVAMDFSPNIPRNITRVPVAKALTNDETDVTGMLKDDDLKYFSQKDIGDNAELEFKAPPLQEGERSVFLHSKGYYQILSDASGLPKAGKLKELRGPMKFTEYSRRLMMEKIAEFNRGKN